MPGHAESVADANASVITAADIQREHPASVSDLLRTRAGVDNSSGAITMRGVQGIAVVLNGLPSTLSDLNQLSLGDIERIEILRGAASARFGANAMGGAIVVTTKRGVAKPVLTLLGSSSGTLGARFGGELAMDSWLLGMTLKDENERGYRSTTVAPYPNQIAVEDERTRRKAVALRANYRGEAGKFGVELKQADTLAHFGRPNWWEHYVVTSGRINAGKTLESGAELTLQAGREKYDDPGLLDAGTGTDAAGLQPDRYIYSIGSKNDVEFAWAHHADTSEMRIGINYQRAHDRISIRPYGSINETFILDSVTVNRALFAHIDKRIGSTVGAAFDGRFDRHEYPDIHVYDALGTASVPATGVVKQSFNPKLEVRWEVADGVKLSTSAGTGFVPPTPDQLYYSDTGSASWMLGNPGLKPQRSQTQDIGLSVQQGKEWSFAATLFHTVWSDKIGVAIIDYGAPLKRQYANIGAVESNGLELETKRQLADKWSATLNYTYNQTRIVRDEAHPERMGNSLPDMPRHKLNAALGYESKDASGRLAMRAISAAFTDEANTVADAQGYKWMKSGYAVLDASLTKRFHDFDVTAAVDNIFDRRYATGFFRIGQPRLLRIE
ncbi:MAG: TonB-dependent receptor, partial [Gallionella sp.]|nr:TonB-dependent receptor [Gallionella sp.]